MIKHLFQPPIDGDAPRPQKWLPYFLLTIPPLCWAGNIVLAQGVTNIIHPVAFAFWRWAMAFMVILPFSAPHLKNDWHQAKQGWRMLVLLSFLGVSCFNTLLYTAVHTTSAINGSLIQTAMPAFIIVITWFGFKERITLIQLFGVTLSIWGATFVVMRGQMANLIKLAIVPGDMLMILAVICYAFYSALLPKRPKIAMLNFLAWTFGLGALGLLPIYIWEIVTRGTLPVTIPVVISIIFVALFPSLLAYFCWNQGIAMIGVNKGGLFINLIPVFASIMSILWLEESLHSFHFIGMAFIGVGMLLFNRK